MKAIDVQHITSFRTKETNDANSVPSHGGCANAVFQTVQRPVVYCDVYGNVHYGEHLKLFDNSRTMTRFWTSFSRDIAIIVQRRNAIFTYHQISATPEFAGLNTELAGGTDKQSNQRFI